MKLKKSFPIICLSIISIAATSCSRQPDRTTDTDSTSFPTLAAKIVFLERYVKFRRSYETLAFDISYLDGEAGMLPSPSEWDIKIFTQVPAESLELWKIGLSPTKHLNPTWPKDIPGAPANTDSFEWYQRGTREVGIDQTQRLVLYRNLAI